MLHGLRFYFSSLQQTNICLSYILVRSMYINMSIGFHKKAIKTTYLYLLFTTTWAFRHCIQATANTQLITTGLCEASYESENQPSILSCVLRADDVTCADSQEGGAALLHLPYRIKPSLRSNICRGASGVIRRKLEPEVLKRNLILTFRFRHRCDNDISWYYIKICMGFYHLIERMGTRVII